MVSKNKHNILGESLKIKIKKIKKKFIEYNYVRNFFVLLV